MPAYLSAFSAAELLLGPIFLLSLLGTAFLCHRLGRVPVSLSPIVAASCQILLLHGAAHVLWLPQMSRCLFYLGLAAPWFVACLPQAEGTRAGPLRRLRSAFAEAGCFLAQPPIAIFFFVSLVFWFSLLGYTFTTWDEFTHWARSSRHFIEHHRLPAGRSDGFLHVSYPPAGALFQYFFYTNVTSSPMLDRGHEGIVVGAQCVLQFLILPVLLTACRWSRAIAACVVLLTAGYLQGRYGHGVNCILIDYVLTVFCAAAILGYFILKKQARSPISLVPCLAVLPIMKDIGVVLAGLAVFVMAVDMLLCTKERRLKQVMCMILLLAAPLGMRQAWEVHLKNQSILDVFGAKQLTVAAMLREISPEASELSREVRANFLRAVTTKPVGTHLLLVVSLPFALCLFRSYQKTLERSDWVLALSLLATVTAYVVAHLFFYLLLRAFSDYERRILASFVRYLYIYTGAVFLTTLGLWAAAQRPCQSRASWTIDEFTKKLLRAADQVRSQRPFRTSFFLACLPNRKWCETLVDRIREYADRFAPPVVWGAAAVMTVLLAYTPPNRWLQPKLAPYPPVHKRLQYAATWKAIEHEVPPNKSLFMIWQKSIGYEVYVTGYELMPRKHNCWFFSVGTPRDETDIWTQPISVDKLKNQMKDYDYLWLGTTDEDFWRRYGTMFDTVSAAQRHEFYRIEKTADAGIRFEPVTMRR